MIDSLGHTMTSVVINPFFQWASDRAPRTPYHETVIYEAHVKGMTQTHPGIPEELRGTYAGLGASGDHRPPQVAERDRDRTDAGAPVHARPPADRPRAAKLLGLQHFRLLRAALPVRRQPARRRRGGGVQDHGPVVSRGRDRGHPRRRLQPHGRRQPPRSDDQLARHRQRRLLPAAGRRPGSTRISPAPATASMRGTRTPCS